MEWIYLEMSIIFNQMDTLQRPAYFENIYSTGRLYQLFKSKGNLSNDQELDKLQQAMILKEKFNRMEQFIKNRCLLNSMPTASGIHLQKGIRLLAEAGNAVYGLDYHFSEEYLNVVINYMNANFHLLAPDTPVKSLARKIRCPNWTTDHETVHLASKTNIFRCMVDGLRPYYKHFNFAHIGRSGLFYSKKNHVLSETGLSSAVLKDEEKKQCIMAIFM